MIRPWFRQAAVPWKTTATQTRASGENRVSTKLGVIQIAAEQVVAVGVDRAGEVQLGGIEDQPEERIRRGLVESPVPEVKLAR